MFYVERHEFEGTPDPLGPAAGPGHLQALGAQGREEAPELRRPARVREDQDLDRLALPGNWSAGNGYRR